MAIVIIIVVINRFSRTKTGVIIIKLKCDKLMVMTDLLCKSLLFSFNKDKDTDMGGKEIDNSQNIVTRERDSKRFAWFSKKKPNAEVSDY